MVNWLQVGQTSGSGDSQILVRASENDTSSRRSTNLLLSGNTKSLTIPVTQGYYGEGLIFNITSSGIVNWVMIANTTGETRSISYSINDGAWNTITSSTAGTSFNVSQGDVVTLSGNTTSYGGVDFCNCFSGTTAEFTISGNINELLSSTGTGLSNYALKRMFQGCTGLTDASQLLLPETVLGDSCYERMFYWCTSLTTGPTVLPATTLPDGCYASMFGMCTGLTTAPVISATTIGNESCSLMFSGCWSLTTPPTLSATSVGNGGCFGMFRSCRTLITVPALPATSISESCYEEMFSDCIALTTAQSTLPATTLAYRCYESMFQDCTALTTAPALPATVLTDECYAGMFMGCTSLTSAPVLSANTLTEMCYEFMFYNCYSLHYIKCLATDRSAISCTRDWVAGVASSGTFYKKSSTTWASGSDGVPYGWTVRNA